MPLLFFIFCQTADEWSVICFPPFLPTSVHTCVSCDRWESWISTHALKNNSPTKFNVFKRVQKKKVEPIQADIWQHRNCVCTQEAMESFAFPNKIEASKFRSKLYSFLWNHMKTSITFTTISQRGMIESINQGTWIILGRVGVQNYLRIRLFRN